MRLFAFLLLFTLAVDLSAQFWPYTPTHAYESFYLKYRREQFKTKLSDYELTGKVRSVHWSYEPADSTRWHEQDQQLVFSPGGLLTNYAVGDTTMTKKPASASRYAENWAIHYNAQGFPDTVRVGKMRDDYRSEYWLAYDSNGYMTNAGTYDARGHVDVKISYKYTWYGSALSVTTSPFGPYDITGNTIGDSVHITFDSNGCVKSEHVFWGSGPGDSLKFSWENRNYFTYSIEGRSYMLEAGTWKTNASGQLLVASRWGYHIDQQGTHGFDTKDSLVYTKEGWLKAEYNEPAGLAVDAEDIFVISVRPNPQPTSYSPPQPVQHTPQMKLYRRYEYTIDSHGNWITRKHFDDSGKLIGAERRVLTYY